MSLDQGSVITFRVKKLLFDRKGQTGFLFSYNCINIYGGLNYSHCSLNPQEEALEKKIFV